jgi:molybdenum cofactor cytidylyltransferase
MDLREAVGLEPGEMVALVGAGGKTTLAWHLATGLFASHERVIFTTTTRIFEPRDRPLMLDPHPDPAEIQDRLAQAPLLFLAAAMGEVGDRQLAAHSAYPARQAKLVGLESGVLDDLVRCLPDVTWLVEADGARGRLLKAPAAYEPVIPDVAGCVVVVACLDAIGRPLDAGVVHRPELAACLLGKVTGTTIAPEDLADLVAHPAGGLKGVPDRARVVVALTQWQDRCDDAVTSVTRRVLEEQRVGRVVWVNLAAEPRVCRRWLRSEGTDRDARCVSERIAAMGGKERHD